jgi:dephospho-CoA kinase
MPLTIIEVAMLKISLTGGIGSGKSTVARLFQEKGVDVIDSDKLALELTQTSQPAYFAITKKFGNQVLTKDGNLDRKALKELVFNDTAHRKWLEELLHPLIIEKIREEIALCTSPYIVVVIPLLVETGLVFSFDRVLVVDLPIYQQLERTMKRDKTDKETILRIISTQATREQRLASATDIIMNDKDIEHLKQAVDKLHSYYLQLTSTQ